MKKLLIMALIAFSIGIVASAAEAKTTNTSASNTLTVAANAAEPQIYRRRNNRRVYRTTRISPNGRRVVTRTTRVSRNGRRVVVRQRVTRRPYRRY